MLERENSFAGFALAAASVLVWGVTFVCTKSLLSDFSALEILFIRFFMAYAVMWLICPRAMRCEKKDEALFAAAGLAGVTLYQFLENSAILFTSASNVSVIVATCPFFTAVIAQIFLNEKHVTIPFVIGFMIALAGVALVSFNGAVEFHLNPKGDLLALLAALSWGFYSLFVSKINSLKKNSLMCARRVFFYAIVFMVPLMLAGIFAPSLRGSRNFFVETGAAANAARFGKFKSWGNLLFLGALASAFCFSAWNAACKRLGASRATVALYLIPVVTIVFARLALGEPITAKGAAGAALTICGLLLSSYGVKRGAVA